jgi:ribonuclease Z
MSETISLRVCDIPISGRSVAGQESFYRLPTLRSALEIGRCPNSIVPVPNILVTHSHLDHAAGIASYASQRALQAIVAGRVFLPAETQEAVEKILTLHAALEGVDRYATEIVGVSPGDRISLRHDLVVEVLPGSHRVPCVGFLFRERRHKLKSDFAGIAGAELARLRERGVEVAAMTEAPLLAYPGDCDAKIFDRAPEIFRARILLIECTFLRPGEEERAAKYRHMHLSDFAARAGDFENEAIVLTHFSAKYSREEIEQRLREGLPERLSGRVTAFV